MKVRAYAAKSKGAKLEPINIEMGPLGPFDVLIKVSHCGLCHTDVHYILEEHYFAPYPLVPGHEIVGTVVSGGEMVDPTLIGSRVGVGYQHSSCLSCEWCLRSTDQLCKKKTTTIGSGHGGFAEMTVADSRFVHPIPDGMASEHAAPLLCAGLTVYGAMTSNGIGPEQRVGVEGIGGLGHIAIMFASAMGCEVTAFSSSPGKEGEALSMGASHFVNVHDAAALRGAAESVDIVLCTSSSNMGITGLLPTVRPMGKVVLLSRTSGDVTITSEHLMNTKRSLTGSITGSRSDMREMLMFAARHNIRPWVEVEPMSKCNEAIERLLANQVRYRVVLRTEDQDGSK